MPTYDYRCLACDLRFEKFQSMADEPIKTCPECGGNVKRLIGTGAGIIFKGEGFYQTDYRSDSYKKDAKKESKKESKKEPDSSASSSSKTEAKAN